MLIQNSMDIMNIRSMLLFVYDKLRLQIVIIIVLPTIVKIPHKTKIKN